MHDGCVAEDSQPCAVGFLLPLLPGFWGSNSGHQGFVTSAITHPAISKAQRIQTLECSPDSLNLSHWGWDGMGASHSRQMLPGCLASEDQSWKKAPVFTGCPWVPSSAALPCGWLTLGTQ